MAVPSCSHGSAGAGDPDRSAGSAGELRRDAKPEERAGSAQESEPEPIPESASIDPGIIPGRGQREERAVAFSDYPVSSSFSGPPASIDYASNRIARRFRSIISTAYREKGKADFAGFYLFVYWNCGSPCQQSALVDVRDGKVYEGPIASLGYHYQVDSRLLIVNPPDPTQKAMNRESIFLPEYWLWNEHLQQFEEWP